MIDQPLEIDDLKEEAGKLIKLGLMGIWYQQRLMCVSVGVYLFKVSIGKTLYVHLVQISIDYSIRQNF